MTVQRGLLAVADAEHILGEDGARYSAAVRAFPHVTDLAAKCLQRGIASLWVMESAGIPAITSAWAADRPGWNIHRPTTTQRAPGCLEIRRDGPREGEPIRHVQVHWLDARSLWDWKRETNATAVLDAVCTYRRAMGRLPAFTPGYIGRDMLVSGMRPGWLALDVPEALADDDEPAGFPVAGELAWVNRSHDWGAGGYLHKYDGNAAWLAIAATQGLGAGAPVRVNASPRAGGYGLWRIRATPGASLYRGRVLPSAWTVIDDEADEHFHGWVWTPTVKQFQQAGWAVEIEGGWVWQEKHMAMRQWALDLWERRQRCPGGSARDAIKRTYASAIASLGYPPVGRPDWHAWILAESVRRQLALIDLLCASGCKLIAAYSDALVYACESPDPAELAYTHPTRGLESILARAEHLGGNKHAGTVRGGLAIHELHEAARDGMPAADWMGAFNRLARGA